MWEYLRPVSEWTNTMMAPPSAHGVELLVAATHNQAVANAFFNNFTTPSKNWELFRSPAAMSQFLVGHGWAPGVVSAVA